MPLGTTCGLCSAGGPEEAAVVNVEIHNTPQGSSEIAAFMTLIGQDGVREVGAG